jgi:hypothetical protein
MTNKILRPGSNFHRAEDLPDRSAPARETAESLALDWIAYYDSLSANEAAVLYKHNSDFARRADILLERRKKNGF